MTINEQLSKNIVARVIQSQDYRLLVTNALNAEFLKFAIDFFKEIVDAKIHSKEITIEWYKNAFINNQNLESASIATNSGLNMKTISNVYSTAKRQVVLDASNEHFDVLYESVKTLVENEPDVDLTLTIKFKGVSVDLNVSESLIVINALAVKRAALRGGLWSTVGKQAEKTLVLTLCKLYKVSPKHYNAQHFVKDMTKAVDREVDFYLLNNGQEFKCEVKLMGKGNPESADAIIARGSKVFVADTLSQQNKNQCDQLGVCWVACRDNEGYKRFKLVLDELKIPYTDYNGNLVEDLPLILEKL